MAGRTKWLRRPFAAKIWRYLSPVQLFVLAVLVLLAALLLTSMSVAAGLREHELEQALAQKTALRRLSADIALVMRYRTFRERPQRLESESPLAEAEMLAEAEQGIEPQQAAAWPLAVVQRFSSLFTAAGRKADERQRYDLLLFAAYLGERQRHYRAAESLWSRALGFAPAADEEAFVLLHRGFCRLFTTGAQGAAADLTRAAELDRSGSVGYTAFSLLVFLHEGRVSFGEIARLPDNEHKAELLYRTGDVKAALAVLEKLPRPGVRATYLRARLLEETGNDERAVQIYQILLAEHLPEMWRLAAAKRLYLLAAFYGVETVQKNSAATLVRQAEPQLFQKMESRRALLPSAESLTEAARLLSDESRQLPEAIGGDTKSATEAELSELRQELYRARQLEKIASEATPRSERVRILQNDFPVLERFELSDGNIVFGIVSRDTGPALLLLTAVGSLALPKEKIVRRAVARLGDTGQTRRGAAGAGLVERLLDPRLSRAERRTLLKTGTKTLDRLILHDGNEVLGLIYAQSTEKISIISVLGPVQVPAELIRIRETVDAKNAFHQ